jgi:hypothetical protein
MERYNVTGVTSGPMPFVRRWRAAAPRAGHPERRVFGEAPLDSMRAWAKDGTIRVHGRARVPVHAAWVPTTRWRRRTLPRRSNSTCPSGVHVGPGPPGAPYLGTPGYRMRLSNPLLLEDVLVRRPTLRLYVMHAGWPMGDNMVALLYAHPQVYVDVGVISWTQPVKEFHRYLRRLVEAGYGERVMFGSDQMSYPDALRIAIENVESADFLTPAQKRDIFYNNAAASSASRPTECRERRRGGPRAGGRPRDHDRLRTARRPAARRARGSC